jgi:hypothetical protein
MDVRRRTFLPEASRRFAAVLDGLGFGAPEVHGDPNSYPMVLTVRFRRSDLTVTTTFNMYLAGESSVETSLVSADALVGTRSVGSGTAQTGSQMRKAIDLQAAAVRRALTMVS